MSRKRMVVRAFQNTEYAWPLGSRAWRTQKWLHRIRRANLRAFKALFHAQKGGAL
jgi:predicted lipoprotein